MNFLSLPIRANTGMWCCRKQISHSCLFKEKWYLWISIIGVGAVAEFHRRLGSYWRRRCRPLVSSHPVIGNLSHPTCLQVFWKKYLTETLKMTPPHSSILIWIVLLYKYSNWTILIILQNLHLSDLKICLNRDLASLGPRDCPWASPSGNLSGLGMLNSCFGKSLGPQGKLH